MFVDEARVHLSAGDGGAGVVSFKRQRGKPRGKPEGGSGGSGGSVIIQADGSVATLLDFKRRPHRKAGSGTHGSGDFQHGRHGEDLILLVPVGTVIRDDEGVLLADLVESGQRIGVLDGGRGGRGNAAFVSPARLAPDFAEQGEFGDQAWFTLELKLMADAALVGFPNAGKSTLISRVSAAKPKIADYPFTTLEPHLGVVDIDGRQFVLADIPGLIEGAADGRGLGHEFLRHTERARALVILLDPSPLQETPLATQYEVLLGELEQHSPVLATRPRVVAINKADVLDGDPPALAEPVHVISAVTGVGVERLMHAIADAVDTARREAPERQGYMLHRPAASGYEIHRVGERWVITGKAAHRAVAFDDLTRPTTADLAARRLARIGVDDALRELGAQDGDEVQIGDIVFEFQDDVSDGESSG